MEKTRNQTSEFVDQVEEDPPREDSENEGTVGHRDQGSIKVLEELSQHLAPLRVRILNIETFWPE